MARRPLRMSSVSMYFVLGLMKPALSFVPPPSEAGFCAVASYFSGQHIGGLGPAGPFTQIKRHSRRRFFRFWKVMQI